MDIESFRRKIWKYLPNFYNDNKFSDFEFLLNDGGKRSGHKFILLLLCDGWNIKNFDTMSILDLSGYRRTTSEMFIRWLYTGAIKTNDKSIWEELLEISVSFDLSSLYDRCKFEIENVDKEIIVEMDQTPENFEEASRKVPRNQEDTESILTQHASPETCIMEPKRNSQKGRSTAKQHKPRSFPQRMHQCQLCEKNFTSQFRLAKHLHSFHKRKVEECFVDTNFEDDDNNSIDVSEKLLNSDPDFEQNLIPNNSERCNGCISRSEELGTDGQHESCSIKRDLGINLQILKTASKFSCQFCFRVFLSEEKLKKHSKSHSKVKVLKCDVCSKVFKTAQNLNRHLRVHTGEKPYLCSHCGQGFIQSTQLQIHLRRHSGERPYHCDHCLKTFASKFIYKQHLDIHSVGQKKYICDVCGQVFNRQSNCRRHIQLHNDSKPYKCEDCGKAYSTKHALKMHKHHSPSATSCQNYGVTSPVSMATGAVSLSNSQLISNTYVQTVLDK